MKLKTKASVWFVAAKAIHGVNPSHARDGWNIHAQHFFPQTLHETAHDIHDIAAVNKAQFKVNLTEFRLAIGAWILVAQAAADLKIPFTTSHH